MNCQHTTNEPFQYEEDPPMFEWVVVNLFNAEVELMAKPSHKSKYGWVWIDSYGDIYLKKHGWPWKKKGDIIMRKSCEDKPADGEIVVVKLKNTYHSEYPVVCVYRDRAEGSYFDSDLIRAIIKPSEVESWWPISYFVNRKENKQ